MNQRQLSRLWISIAIIGILFILFITVSFSPIELGHRDNAWTALKRRVQKFYYWNLQPDPNFLTPSWLSLKHFYGIPLSSTPIDIVIPLVEKDIKSAHHAIDAARQLLMHPIGKIFIISPESEKIRFFAHQKNAIFILENTLLPTFRKNPPTAGWYKQQYLKLSADKIVEQEHYLILDSDTILIRPQVFTRKGKTIFNVCNQYSFARKRMVAEALNIQKFRNMDFVCHHMLFEKSKVNALKIHLEKIHGKNWQDALNELKSRADLSEYELYANFFDHFFPNEIRILASRNTGIPSDRLEGLEAFRAALAPYYKTLSFHHFQTFSFLTAESGPDN